MKYRTEEIRGEKFEIEIASDGRFFTVFDGETVYAESLKGLKEKLMNLTKQSQAKVKIDFWRWVEDRWRTEKGELKHGVITGEHAGNSNVMIKFDGESAEQDRGWNSDDYLKLDAGEQKQYVKLHRDLEALKKQIEKFEDEHKFDPREAIREAVKRVEKTA